MATTVSSKTFKVASEGIAKSRNAPLINFMNTIGDFLAQGLGTGPNPRGPYENGPVTKGIEALFLKGEIQNFNDFTLGNNGVTVTCRDAEISPDRQTITILDGSILLDHKEVPDGIANGGTTYSALKSVEATLRLEDTDMGHRRLDAFLATELSVSLLLDIDGEKFVRAVKSRNTNRQVKETSLVNLEGGFESLKKRLGPAAEFFSWHENDVGTQEKKNSCFRLIQQLLMFGADAPTDPTVLSHSIKHPTSIYARGIGPAVKLYIEGQQSSVRLRNTIKAAPFIIQMAERVNEILVIETNKRPHKVLPGVLKDKETRSYFNHNKSYSAYVPVQYVLMMTSALRVLMDDKGDFSTDPQKFLDTNTTALYKKFYAAWERATKNGLPVGNITDVIKESSIWEQFYDEVRVLASK